MGRACRFQFHLGPVSPAFLALLMMACASGTAKAGTKAEHLYLFAGTPTIYSPDGFPVRLYSVANGRLVLARRIATGLTSVANDLAGHLYVLSLGMRDVTVIHENTPGEVDVVPAPPRLKGRIARFSPVFDTWGAIAGPGVPPSAVFVGTSKGNWIVIRIYAREPSGESRVAFGSWNLYGNFRYAGNGGGPFQQFVPAAVIIGGRLCIMRGRGPDSCRGVLGPTPPFLPSEAGAATTTVEDSTGRHKVTFRGAAIVADTARFFAFNAPLPNTELRSPRTIYVLNKVTGHWSVMKLPFYGLWPRLYGAWLVTTVQEPNPEGRISPGLENERAREVDVHTPTGMVRALPRIRGMYSSKIFMPGKLSLQNLLDGRKLTITTGQQDSEMLDVRKDGLVLYRVNNEIFSARIEGEKLSAPKLVVKDEDVPEVHWAFWSRVGTKPYSNTHSSSDH